MFDHDRFYWLLQVEARGLARRELFAAAGLSPHDSAMHDPARLADQLNYQPQAVRTRLLGQLETALGLQPSDYPAEYALMDWEMVREMAAGGITFGAHTQRHVVLTLEAMAEAEREIRGSKQTLEEQLQCPARHFAYPNGHYNRAVRNLVERAGFASATTTERVLAQQGIDPFTLGRISLCEESTRGISGNYARAVARLRLRAWPHGARAAVAARTTTEGARL